MKIYQVSICKAFKTPEVKTYKNFQGCKHSVVGDNFPPLGLKLRLRCRKHIAPRELETHSARRTRVLISHSTMKSWLESLIFKPYFGKKEVEVNWELEIMTYDILMDEKARQYVLRSMMPHGS